MTECYHFISFVFDAFIVVTFKLLFWFRQWSHFIQKGTRHLQDKNNNNNNKLLILSSKHIEKVTRPYRKQNAEIQHAQILASGGKKDKTHHYS